ncbi:pentatricopeptide repeat-containing protein At2g03380, mitochondrial [Malania oleifera]|uniref:pentatricopeptide repeat-containing protein At2g03380, mitochondrial n=1 Tax=Malania oleifera TaxID=397392 RepID=UPI0025ADCE20|nr:pentatricopeptide repeat-containing protein At2g03380, mitochondrial [Malania oleifera]
MMKLLSPLHRHVPFFRKPQLQWRALTVTTDQYHPDYLQFDQTIASLQSASSNLCFALLGICRNIVSLKKIHGLFIVHGFTGDLLCETKLVSLYGLYGHIEIARSVFDRIQNPDFYSWKVMIRWYFMNDLYQEIIRVYIRMRECIGEHDNVVFSIVLKACSELRDFDEGRKVHCQVVKVGSPDSFVLTGLVDMYAKCGEIDCSRHLFDEIPEKNVVSCTSMIAGYAQNDCAEEGLILFNRMREWTVEVNQFTLGSIVTACTKLGALHQGRWIHGYVIKSGIGLNSFLVTAVLDMYVKCKAIRDARSIFDEFSIVDVVSWTAMVVGYSQSGLPYEALKLFTDKRPMGLLPNSVTAASVLSACAQSHSLNLGQSTHSLGIKLGLEDAIVKNALVDMYAKFHMIGDARYLFETFSDRDVVSWNSIISGYSQNGSAYEALKLYHQMRLESVLPDAITIVSVLTASAALGALQFGSSLQAYSIKEGLLLSNVYVGTAFLNLYAKCGDAKSARRIFDQMGDKNVITWSAMIRGYGVHGDSCESLALFSDMLKEDLEPNEVIFTAILSACSHTGMVGEGWQCFNLMCQDYNFVPSMKHYACMVDLLARSGRLEEALDFIEKMPVLPDVSLFGAFLHGCRLYSRFDLGEVAVKRLLELHPDQACYYVLMSNLYASDGRWNQANQVRQLMKKRGLSKSPGSSLVGPDIHDESSSLRLASLA